MIILASILSVMVLEVVLRIQRGLPPLESDSPQFEYQYEEIYKKFFRKIRLSNGTVVYKTQHSKAEEQSFPVSKIKETKRIFVLGGSVAMPFSGGLVKYFKELLESSILGERFEIIGCGAAAYDSYRVSLIHKEILNYDPDFIILMVGNNEYYTPVRINIWAYKLNKRFRNLWIYRDLQERLLTWGRGHGMYNISQENRPKNYENNLKIMIHRAKKRKIPMVLCTLPTNFRDCPPKQGISVWQDKQFFLAWKALNEKRFEEAKNGF